MDNNDREEYAVTYPGENKKPYFWGKMIGFSLIGGLISGLLFYIYDGLSEGQKRDIKELVVENSKPAIARFISEKLDI